MRLWLRLACLLALATAGCTCQPAAPDASVEVDIAPTTSDSELPSGPIWAIDAWKASHIVKATRRRDGGVVVVVESLKGDLLAGEELTVPFLAVFDDPAERTITAGLVGFGSGFVNWKDYEPRQAEMIRGNDMFLFLRHHVFGRWGPANPWVDNWFSDSADAPSVAWIDSGCAYLPLRGTGRIAPPPVGFIAMHALAEPDMPGERTLPEGGLRKGIVRVVKLRNAFDRANATCDSKARAEALYPFIGCELQCTINDTFEALVDCGKPAVPVLARLLDDERHARVHWIAIYHLSEIGGHAADEVLVRTAWREADYFRGVANSPREPVPEGYPRCTPADARHQLETLELLRALKKSEPRASKSAVGSLRDGLRAAALPEGGLNTPGLVTECEQLLASLGD